MYPSHFWKQIKQFATNLDPLVNQDLFDADKLAKNETTFARSIITIEDLYVLDHA